MKSNKQVVLISGGGSGIGKEIARKFLTNDYIVIIFGRTEERLLKARDELGGEYENVEYKIADVTDDKQIKKIFIETFKKYHRIDILINNAGYSSGKNFEDSDLNSWSKEIDVNLSGTYICSKNVINFMKHGGSIINISSERAKAGSDASVGYAASKAGVVNLTKSLAIQLAKYKIRVNCISPAAIDNTNISLTWSKQLRNNIVRKIPLGRLGQPEDVSNLVYFLASKESSFITGVNIDINGGFSM
jgi:NAD(P)-dependent dehydrogenase (short-subunit alcohol dehydrogenase family)